jgi:3-oxoacyl-[acyl-carrier-protein] synthase-3
MKKEGIGVGVLGMGAFFPPQVRRNDWWSENAMSTHMTRRKGDVVTAVYDTSACDADTVDPEVSWYTARYAGDPFRGAKERRVTAEGEGASDLEARAVRAALEDANISPSNVGMLISSSQLSDFPCPANHGLVAAKAGLPDGVSAITVNTDCASFVSAFAVAARFIQARECRNAVIVQSNTTTRVVDHYSPSSINVGDGAVATVLGPTEPGTGYIANFTATHGHLHGGVRLSPSDSPSVPWYRGDLHARPLVLGSMDAEATQICSGRSVSFCGEASVALLEQAGYEVSDLNFFVTSQPTVWFARACCDRLGIPPEKTVTTFERYGYLLPASAPANLWEARQRGLLEAGDLALIYTPAPGFMQAAMLLRWS